MAVTKIAQVDVGAGGAASIDFTSIPQGYTDVMVVVSGRTSTVSATGTIVLDLNGDTTNANYPQKNFSGTGSGLLNDGSAQRPPIQIVGSTATASTFGNVSIYIPNYAGSTTKSISIDAVGENNATAARAQLVAALWSNTAAITRITLNGAGDTIQQYSSATLYGVTKGTSSGVTVA